MSDSSSILLRIDGQPRLFTPIKAYRAAHDLPLAFGVALFEPKAFAGLGNIDHAGSALNAVRASVLNAVPLHLPSGGWMAFLPSLRRVFAEQLTAINPQVSLKAVEITFAVTGFNGVCEAVAFALLRAQVDHVPPRSFAAIYADWLDDSVRVAMTPYSYHHAGGRWSVRVVQHAYGRVGLLVERADLTDAVYDPALGCPVEGFMASLLSEVGARMLET